MLIRGCDVQDTIYEYTKIKKLHAFTTIIHILPQNSLTLIHSHLLLQQITVPSRIRIKISFRHFQHFFHNFVKMKYTQRWWFQWTTAKNFPTNIIGFQFGMYVTGRYVVNRILHIYI